VHATAIARFDRPQVGVDLHVWTVEARIRPREDAGDSADGRERPIAAEDVLDAGRQLSQRRAE
jgi:hypothetical protein